MTMPLPQGAPATLRDAFAHIGAVTAPTVLDVKVLALTEAAAMTLYYKTAEGTDNAAVRDLLHANGREEFLHAQRAALAVKAISGEDFFPPLAEDNPYLQDGGAPFAPVTAEALKGLAQGEFGGEALYEKWAVATDNAEAARLFRLNGKEETDHGNRLLQAAALL
ncbi:ferritin-like domain-containing protein [Novosphingobium sp. B 225]|uniref:ferritin-like domain-containing protein n=1 Tax=Novosphingobium sp. B 225 TaxID=1961849 RepID=UPI0011250DC3|nr:ferritin-like domain-containing protein [Novosphingobium sp. B 225]